MPEELLACLPHLRAGSLLVGALPPFPGFVGRALSPTQGIEQATMNLPRREALEKQKHCFLLACSSDFPLRYHF